MAVPKRKVCRGRSGRRRSHQRLAARSAVACPHCGASKLPHRVCSNCGTLNGRELLRKREEA